MNARCSVRLVTVFARARASAGKSGTGAPAVVPSFPAVTACRKRVRAAMLTRSNVNAARSVSLSS